ncbi:ClpP/crotonase [Thelephora terrestris]|uniref:ClpP/crotonase n=1 Tax=Thelephora terrestris TaxID=56493 RepID=A0A9P6HPI7_9AGAM|nr:ClpP/crotonase [Thelephora terrestris]
MTSTVSVEFSGPIATITFNRPESLNAITAEGLVLSLSVTSLFVLTVYLLDYEAFANALRNIDKNPAIIATVWQATGKWFCAGTDVKARGRPNAPVEITTRNLFASNVVPTHLDTSKAVSEHSKILVAALNGPVMGIAAALLGHFDFIYALPGAWFQVPFTFLGIIAEAGSSVSFVNRVGIARANELLLFGKRKTAQELLECGFYNEIFPETSVEKFHQSVNRRVAADLDGLVADAVLKTRQLLRYGLNERNNMDSALLREGYVQAERLVSGVPSERFNKIARKEIRHKL